MPTNLRFFLVFMSGCACVYAIWKIRREQMKIENAMYWFFITGLFLIFSLFPQAAAFCARVMGIESTANFIYLITIFLLYVKVFSLSLKNAALNERLNVMAQEVAIWKKEIEDEEENTCKD